MEIVIAVLLLFGAFSLGAATQDRVAIDAMDRESPVGVQSGGEEQETPSELHSHTSTQLHDCIANHPHVIYRDLTLPNINHDETETARSSDCGGACGDE